MPAMAAGGWRSAMPRPACDPRHEQAERGLPLAGDPCPHQDPPEDVKKIFKTTTGTPFLFPTTGTGAWESALTNTLSPGDRIVSFSLGQFSLLWIDQQQRLGFSVDVVESDWGYGADLGVLESKLRSDSQHTL
ncbi:hypothetical protein ZWY2020_057440 [Hordeum vulgare]|nr:hypothetical protein ZWY2020_057440 [Hordeum vulgare]